MNLQTEIKELPINLRRAFFNRISLDNSETSQDLADQLWLPEFESKPLDMLPKSKPGNNMISGEIISIPPDNYCQMVTSEELK